MGLVVRSFLALCSALVAVAAFGAPTAVPILAANTTALIMGGTFHPLMGPQDSPEFVKRYLDNAVNNQLAGAYGVAETNAVAVYTPEDFLPIGRLTFDKSVAEGLANLGRCLAADAGCVFNTDPDAGSAVAPQLGDTFLVFGYSQSAAIASLLKKKLIDEHGPGSPSASFMLTANPMRPNGGVLGRFPKLTIPLIGITFHGATPTDSVDGAFKTVDVVRQYDGFGGDFPVRPLNLLATVNALLGYGMMHAETVDVPFARARYQGRVGDTDYYLIESDLVPLLQPLRPFVPAAILSALDVPLRVIIEDAYDRDVGPGRPTPAKWWPIKDLAGIVAKLVASVPVALDNLTEGFGQGRVFGTTAPGAFGVGGVEWPAGGDDPAAGGDDPESVTPQRVSKPAGRDRQSPDVQEEHDEEIRAGVDFEVDLGEDTDADTEAADDTEGTSTAPGDADADSDADPPAATEAGDESDDSDAADAA